MHSPLKVSGCILALAALAGAQPKNPFDTPQGVEQGRALFQVHCAYCHGARGEGGRGADLTTGQYRRGGSDAELYATIRNGIPGTEMPVVNVTDDQVWKLAAFVKKLGSGGLSEKATGNTVAGKTIFEGKGRCFTCHSVGLTGGSLGPDLTDVGRRRDLKYLEESIVNPAADVPLRYRALQVVLSNGSTVTGVRLNEDDVSIQLRDTDDNLRSFLKNTIKDIRRDNPSPMPAYATSLNKKEIEDLVAYLNSLRGVR